MYDLTDKVALVTGSAHRIGKAIALALAARGAKIMVHYHDASQDEVRSTLRDIKAEGIEAIATQADLADPNAVENLMNEVESEFGRIDVLVNNASVFPSAHLLDVTLENWNQTMNVNLRAPFLLTQRAARLMRNNNPSGGVIVNVGDQGSFAPWPDRPHHGISKAGLWMLTQVSAISLAPSIRVNAVMPGPVMKSQGMSDDAWARIGDQLPLHHNGQPSDVAEAVLYLVTQSYSTGVLLPVNGGQHLLYPEMRNTVASGDKNAP